VKFITESESHENTAPESHENTLGMYEAIGEAGRDMSATEVGSMERIKTSETRSEDEKYCARNHVSA